MDKYVTFSREDAEDPVNLTWTATTPTLSVILGSSPIDATLGPALKTLNVMVTPNAMAYFAPSSIFPVLMIPQNYALQVPYPTDPRKILYFNLL
jgi:hypothetical protein